MLYVQAHLFIFPIELWAQKLHDAQNTNYTATQTTQKKTEPVLSAFTQDAGMNEDQMIVQRDHKKFILRGLLLMAEALLNWD